MTKEIKFSTANIKNFRREYQAAIDEISRKYGFQAELGRITYEDSEFRCKLTVSNVTLKMSQMKKPAITPSTGDNGIIGKSFKLRNSIYTITEIKSPGVYIGVTQRGKRYKIPAHALNSMSLVK